MAVHGTVGFVRRTNMMVRQAHQPSWVGYVIKNLAVVAFVVGFVACGGDSGTSSAGSPTEPEKVSESSSSLSESEESSSSKDDDSSSSVIPSVGSAGVEGSSSSKADPDSHQGDEAKSSGSVVPNSSSVIPGSDRESSSSVSSVTPSDGSSSSVGGVSSSSVASSSSSASVVPSSSSAEESSSSVYVPFDHKIYLASVYDVGEDAYKQFTDERNGRSYYYITIAGMDTSGKDASVTVMAENLNIGDFVYGILDQDDDSKIERYCYNDDTTNCDRDGGLYQWAEMMALPSECNNKLCADKIQPNHQGICPDGWRLLTYNDFYIAWHAKTNTDGVKGLRSGYFSGSNESGYSLIGAGFRSVDGSFKNRRVAEYWSYPEEDDETVVFSSGIGTSNYSPGSGDVSNKLNGQSVRCVKVE